MGNVIYVLNFANHSFTSHDFIEDACEYVKSLFANGLDYSEVEVIVCYDGDDSRMDGYEFLHKHADDFCSFLSRSPLKDEQK